MERDQRTDPLVAGLAGRVASLIRHDEHREIAQGGQPRARVVQPAVIALVSEPMWKRSFTVTGVSVPDFRTPTAPAATRPSPVTIAPASPGSRYLRRIGSSATEISDLDGADVAAEAGGPGWGGRGYGDREGGGSGGAGVAPMRCALLRYRSGMLESSSV